MFSSIILIDDEPVEGPRPDVRLLFQEVRPLPWKIVICNAGIARTQGWKTSSDFE